MDRRNFMTLAAAAGLGLVLPPRRARATSMPFGGPYWITIQAEGGWDPTCLCDPKGGVAGNHLSINQSYTPDQIGHAGAFSYAPISLSLPSTGGQTVEVYSAKRFFESYGSKLIVLNGVDTATNNHEVGRRVIWSGQSAEGYPSVGALAAAATFGVNPAPMAFLSYGGYDVTSDTVPLTRASNIDDLWRVAYPNRIDPRMATGPTYLTPATTDRIARAQAARVARLLGQEPPPVARRSLSSLLSVRQGDTGLAEISQYLPAKLVTIDDIPDLKPIASGQRGQVESLQNLMQQSQLALAAFQGGLGVSASLVLGGFDTHSNHDNNHIPQLVQLLRGLDYLYSQAAAVGLADKLYVAVGSDFGRTPYYNAGNGKDHWTVTSMIFSGPGIAGGRVLGGTDAAFQPKTFDPVTLQESSGGTRIQPVHVHHALRQLGGFETGALAAQFPLPGKALPFFG